MKTPKDIDLEQVEEMAAEFCTQDEIAEDMGFNRSLFTRRKDVRSAFFKGYNAAKTSLRHMMYSAARQGDRTTMIFLAKNELGYRDNPAPLIIENNQDNKPKDNLLQVLKEKGAECWKDEGEDNADEQSNTSTDV